MAVSHESDPSELEAVRRTPAVSAAAAGVPAAAPSGSAPGAGGVGAIPLSSALRRRFEPALDTDLSGVRLHTDVEAARQAAALGATAFTLGRDIWFGAGQFEPQSSAGRALLAHELIHAVEHASLDRVHRQPTATGAGPRRATGPGSASDPVVLIEVVQDSGVAVLTTQSGAHLNGSAAGIDLPVGAYSLTPHYVAPHPYFSIGGVEGGVHFFLKVFDPNAALDSASEDVGAFSLSYATAMLRVTPAAPAAGKEAEFDLEPTFKTIGGLLDSSYVTGGEEESIIRLIEAVPASKSAEFLRRLSQTRPDGHTWLEALDSRTTGDNNLRLHEALSLQRLRSAPEQAVAALAKAPVLPWHDVMGFFEDDATFAAEPGATGKVRVRYLGGTRLITSKDFGSEIANLPTEIFIGGVEYDESQPLIVHDYDTGRFVTVTAGELAGYQHLGVRNFLGHVATVASFAIPLSAAETVAGKVAVVALERVLPAVFLLVDENRQNLIKWFPRWGPQMIRYADTLKTFAAAVGFARLAVSGFQTFQQWRAVSRSRAALEGAARLDANAERVAAALQKDAEDAYAQAEKVRTAESPAGAAESSTGPTPTHDAPGGPQATQTGARGAGTVEAPPTGKPLEPPPATKQVEPAQPGAKTADPTKPPAAANRTPGSVWEGINDETRAELAADQELREGLERNPLAADVVKLCQSPCYPKLTKAQCARLEKALERAEQMNVPVNRQALRRAFKATNSSTARDELIGQIEEGVNRRVQFDEFAETQKLAGEHAPVADAAPELDEGFHLTEALRDKPGIAHGGTHLTVRTQLIEPGSGVGPFPGQIAARMRRIANFANFGKFRETFWQLVAEDPQLNIGWSQANLTRMRQGLAPVVRTGQATGGGANRVLQLNHIQAIEHAGQVFDLDNIEIVTPRWHVDIGQ
jgi:hypothetical protein